MYCLAYIGSLGGILALKMLFLGLVVAGHCLCGSEE